MSHADCEEGHLLSIGVISVGHGRISIIFTLPYKGAGVPKEIQAQEWKPIMYSWHEQGYRGRIYVEEED